MLLRVILVVIFVCVSQCKLYQVFAFFRHGARYHTNDIYDANDTYPMRSELTPIGMRMHENLGKMFRKNYIEKLNLLTDKYNSTELEIYSTLYHRTMQSAVSFSYGLYPAGFGTKLPNVESIYHLPPYASNHSDIQQQIFALPNGHQIITVKFDDKVILKDCTNWDELTNQIIQTKKLQYQEINLRYYPFLKSLTQNFFKNQTKTISIEQAVEVYDTLYVDRYLNKPLPNVLTEADFENLQHINSWYYMFTMSGRLAHLVNTYKLKKVINQCQNRISQPKTYSTKMTVISCHDTDIAALFTDFNISSSQCVEEIYRKGKTDALNCDRNVGFASNVVIQLHSDDQKSFYVMIRANGKYVNICQKQSTKCPYAEFSYRVKNMFLDNVEEICKH